MTREDIIRMAREAGWSGIYAKPLFSITMQEDDFLRFAALVVVAERERIIVKNAPEIEKINNYIEALEAAVAAEREACAKVCEEFVMGSPFAAAIRARGEE